MTDTKPLASQRHGRREESLLHPPHPREQGWCPPGKSACQRQPPCRPSAHGDEAASGAVLVAPAQPWNGLGAPELVQALSGPTEVLTQDPQQGS